ncbi:hypothetical protein NDU88_006417 [Pleurodeles waltl]|uniref:Uncharacterized protein n=1 Tax=Pleurodeles waltl TaxID=8319 RepID=A0AAV7QHW5_PLEWA|nr:hypothetical protein NDU88_006417 [Pleurodeles waltl]
MENRRRASMKSCLKPFSVEILGDKPLFPPIKTLHQGGRAATEQRRVEEQLVDLPGSEDQLRGIAIRRHQEQRRQKRHREHATGSPGTGVGGPASTRAGGSSAGKGTWPRPLRPTCKQPGNPQGRRKSNEWSSQQSAHTEIVRGRQSKRTGATMTNIPACQKLQRVARAREAPPHKTDYSAQ